MIRQDFKDMVIELTPNIADDEEQYGRWIEKTGIVPQPLGDIWHIPMYFTRDDYFKDDPHYFDHVWLSRGQEDWDNIWMKQSSKQEVDAVSAYDDPDIKPIWTENIGLERRL